MGNKQTVQDAFSAKIADDGVIKQITASTTLEPYQCVSSIGTLTADITITLPPLSTSANKTFAITCGVTGTYTVTVAPFASAEKIACKEGAVPSIVWGAPIVGEVLILKNVAGLKWVVLSQDMQSVSWSGNTTKTICPNQTLIALISAGGQTWTLPALATVPVGRIFTLYATATVSGSTVISSGSEVKINTGGASQATVTWDAPAAGDQITFMATAKGWILLANIGATLS